MEKGEGGSMKECWKCKLSKNISDFYKDKSKYDGICGQCKSCDKESRYKNRAFNRAHYREVERKYLRTEKGKSVAKASREKFVKKHPLALKAHREVHNALKTGLLTYCDCVFCGQKAQAHHPDYTKPLDVIWLCTIHHKQIHMGRISL